MCCDVWKVIVGTVPFLWCGKGLGFDVPAECQYFIRRTVSGGGVCTHSARQLNHVESGDMGGEGVCTRM